MKNNQSSIFFSLVVESVVNPNHNPFTIPHDNDVFMLRDKERQKKKQVMSCNYSWTCICSTVISTHLVVSSQLSKFQMFPLNQYNFHLYEAAKLLNSCGHLWMSPNGLFVLTLPPGRVTLNRINPANKTMNNISDKIESMFLSWNQCLAVFLRKFFFFFFFTRSGQLWHKVALFIAFFISGVLWNLNYSNQWLTLY